MKSVAKYPPQPVEHLRGFLRSWAPMSHSDAKTTMRYTHAVTEDGRKTAARLGQLLISPARGHGSSKMHEILGLRLNPDAAGSD